MKLIKKLTTILFAFMVVLTTTNMVFAANTGKITINNAVEGQTYKIYKIFDLESYDDTNGRYSYKVVEGWKEFFNSPNEGSNYIEVKDDYVVKWKGDETDARKAEFAKKALEFANKTGTTITADGTVTVSAGSATAEFTSLQLGYYLVDSSIGTLCYLDTTKTEATITEKNIAPTIEKQVKKAGGSFATDNIAKIGDTIEFKTTITAQSGAKNYKLIDMMDSGLKLDTTSIKVYKNDAVVANTTNIDYELVIDTATLGTGETFVINFTDKFCNELKKDDTIKVEYSAELIDSAITGTTGNKNKTKLTYGDGNKISTDLKETTTKTFEIPVFKYEEITAGTKNALAGAKFRLSTKPNPTATSDYYKLVAVTGEDRTYRIAKDGETDIEQITTVATTSALASGENYNFKIKGLTNGKYYLIETEAPKGYNKCKPIEINVSEEGAITIGSETATTAVVNIENKTSALLPSTGGVGTTMMYIVGAALLIGSGVLLITKKNAK